MKYFVFIVLLCVCYTMGSAQYLSDDKLKEDLFFLQSHIHEYCSFLPLAEKRTNTNIDSEFEKLKSKINQVKTKRDFLQIVRQGLNAVYDIHTNILGDKDYLKDLLVTRPTYYIVSIGKLSLKDTLNVEENYRLITDSVFAKAKYGIRTKYMNGKYYNLRPFVYNDTIVEAGEEIKKIDGIPIAKFVNDNRLLMYYCYWDTQLKQWYSDLFTIALPLVGKSRCILTVGNRNIALDSSKSVNILKREHSQSMYPQMALMDNDKIMYVRMPSMDLRSKDWYIENFFKTYKPGVSKLIIDVRGNAGGNDHVWMALLKKIVANPLVYTMDIGFNHNEQIEKDILGHIAPTSEFSKLKAQQTLKPDSNSVRFNGKIYILHDKNTYSSASSLASLGMNQEQIISVGEPASYMSGMGFTPAIFVLPNSRIVFQLGFTTDLSGGKSNPYMDKVKVPIVENDISAYSDKVLNQDCYSLEYLANKDKLIEYVKRN